MQGWRALQDVPGYLFLAHGSGVLVPVQVVLAYGAESDRRLNIPGEVGAGGTA
jgi:hypothetical protein